LDFIFKEEDEPVANKRASYTAPLTLLNEISSSENVDPFEAVRKPKISDREDEYRAKRMNAIISPARLVM